MQLRQWRHGGGSDEACGTLHLWFNIAAESRLMNRHMSGEMVAPFFRIEPTTLFKNKDNGMTTSAGFGMLCGTMENNKSEAYPIGSQTIGG